MSCPFSHHIASCGRRPRSPGRMRRPHACSRAIGPRPSHLTCQWLRARRICRTTITDVCCFCRYISEGDDAGAASEDDDDEDAEEEVEEEEDAEAAARKSSPLRDRSHDMKDIF